MDKVITYIGKRYAKYTWLQLLLYLRKWFIIFNAIIGVVTVFKVTGYSSDNMIAGLYGLGEGTYIEIFTSFVKRAFNYLFELFDHKVVPNVPGDSPSNNSWRWGPKQNTWITPLPFPKDGVKGKDRNMDHSTSLP